MQNYYKILWYKTLLSDKNLNNNLPKGMYQICIKLHLTKTVTTGGEESLMRLKECGNGDIFSEAKLFNSSLEIGDN